MLYINVCISLYMYVQHCSMYVRSETTEQFTLHSYQKSPRIHKACMFHWYAILNYKNIIVIL